MPAPSTARAPAQPTLPSTSKPAPRAPRMTLASIVTTATAKPLRLLVHGVEKIGKSTLGAESPSPIFICPEDGLPPDKRATAHYPSPPDGWTWQDVIDAVRALTNGEHNFRTLVVDTLDWIEPLLWKDVCERNGWANIEEPGYGKGFTAAIDGWRSFLAELEQLRAKKGMHVVLLAHSIVRTFKNPTGEDYDRFQMKLHEKSAGVLKEWVDAVLFARHEDVAVKDTKAKRSRGVSTGARYLYTVHNAAYDAGNRCNLPERLNLDASELWAALKGEDAAERAATLRASIEESLAVLVDETKRGKARAAMEGAGDDVAKLAQINNRVLALLDEQTGAALEQTNQQQGA